MSDIVIVTGGSSNIGWACAQRMAMQYAVVIADVCAPAAPLPSSMRFIRTDVTNPEDCRAMMEQVRALGALRIVVHSAAITAPVKPIEQISLDEWRRVIDVNLTGAFIVAQAAIPALRTTKGNLVMIASRAARTGVAALIPSGGTKPHYCASKAGVLSLVKSLAVELAADGVRVNAVLPGSIEGAMIPRERWPDLIPRIPLGRLGVAKEIADAVAYLSSAEASYITGHALDVNGGTWMN
jgi:3-oxoacyl-[acyl-carrier protein] reductase